MEINLFLLVDHRLKHHFLMSLFIMLLFLLFFRFSKENRCGKIMFHSCT